MGRPIINANDIITSIVLNSTPVGMAEPVAAVILAVILAASGSVLINENSGEITAASTNPAIKAHIDLIADSIRAYETTGIFTTSLPYSSNFTPPNFGTNAL